MRDKGEVDSMDTEEIRNRIIRLNEEIEKVLLKAGYPECYAFSPSHGNKYDMQVADVVFHLGYVNSVVKGWENL